MRRIRALVAATVVAVPLLAAACGGAENLPAGASQTSGPTTTVPASVAATVILKYVSFEPSIVKIAPGQTVEWEWEDAPIPHDVTFTSFVPAGGGSATAVSFASALQVTGTWYHTFTDPGTYYYHCTIHLNMTGEVIVGG